MLKVVLYSLHICGPAVIRVCGLYCFLLSYNSRDLQAAMSHTGGKKRKTGAAMLQLTTRCQHFSASSLICEVLRWKFSYLMILQMPF